MGQTSPDGAESDMLRYNKLVTGAREHPRVDPCRSAAEPCLVEFEEITKRKYQTQQYLQNSQQKRGRGVGRRDTAEKELRR